ncbi:WxL protein peptidoglycan domain-containing protein [Propionicicella superfundia]|uniref:WxL protein peptidoglycan domain-containing protein n=1 Tax=Propionicicella superfundia TaxID=348582 RepID=UPI000407A995|nr:DUF916 domain-containing protein [Propionicicella superfundia]
MNLLRVVRLVRTLLTTAILVLCAVVALPAASARADDTTGIAIAPVSAKGVTDGRSRFTYQVDPGQKLTDHVRVSNAGTTSIKVTVFATDAYNADNGDFALRDTAEKATGAGSWVSFGGKPKLTLTLTRGQSRVIPFTVTVPKDATPGDHPGGVVASATQVGDITVERRIANRMYVRVSGDLQPNLTISSLSGAHKSGLNPADGSVTVTATITNSGNVALEGVLTLSASTWFGIGVGETTRQPLSEILPGNTRTVVVELAGVPQAGYAQVKLLLQSGISGDAPDPGPLPVVERDVFVFAVPWIVLGVLALAVAVWLVLRWRRRRDAKRAAEWLAYTEAEARRQATQAASAAPEAPPGQSPPDTGQPPSPHDIPSDPYGSGREGTR